MYICASGSAAAAAGCKLCLMSAGRMLACAPAPMTSSRLTVRWAQPGRNGRCVSTFLDESRRYIGAKDATAAPGSPAGKYTSSPACCTHIIGRCCSDRVGSVCLRIHRAAIRSRSTQSLARQQQHVVSDAPTHPPACGLASEGRSGPTTLSEGTHTHRERERGRERGSLRLKPARMAQLKMILQQRAAVSSSRNPSRSV
jgi:hypothetical protein